MPRARTISHPRSRRIFAPAARSLIPGTVYRSIEKPPPCFRSSSTAAAAISYRAKDVSTMPIRLRPFPGDAGAERRRPLGSPAFRLDRAALGAPAIPPPSSRSCASRRGRPRTARGGRPASPALAGGTPRGSAPLGAPGRTPRRRHPAGCPRGSRRCCLRPQDRPVHGLEGLDHLQPGFLRHDRLVLEPSRRAIPRDDDPQLVAEFPRLAEEIQMAGMEEIEDPRRHYTDHERHARTMSCPSRKTRFLSRAYAFACSFGRARPSSAIISQMVALGASPAMIVRAVVSSVWPRRSASNGSAAFSRGTCPGERNSSAKACAAQPFSRRSASFAISANRAIVFARSASVTPVYVSRWLTAIENALCRSYFMSSVDTAFRIGYIPPARRRTSVMYGSPSLARTSPDTVAQMSPPASFRRVRMAAGVTNSLAIARSVSSSRPSAS